MAIKYTTSIDMANNRVLNVGAPTAPSDAATKTYVDGLLQGLQWKLAVRAASDAALNVAAPGASIDGVALATGDRVLLKDQADATENGIYTFAGAAAAMTRASDADAAGELRGGAAVAVQEGTANGDKTFVLISDGDIDLGVDDQAWTLLNGGRGPDYTAGNGVDLTNAVITAVAASNGGLVVGSSGLSINTGPGVTIDTNKLTLSTGTGIQIDGSNALSVYPGDGLALDTGAGTVLAVADPNGGLSVGPTGIAAMAAYGITVNSDGVNVQAKNNGGVVVDANGVAVKAGSAVSVDASGVNVVADPDGGLSIGAAGIAANPVAGGGLVADATGLAVDTAVVARVYTALVGDGAASTIDITHSMGTYACTIEVFENSGERQTVLVDARRPDANTVRLAFGAAPAVDEYQVVITGFSSATV